MEELPSREAIAFYISPVHELSGGSAVYQCWSGFDLSSVSGLNFYLDY
jgi:hypothetical protein